MTQNSLNPEKRVDDRWTQPLDRNLIEYLLELEVRKATRYLYYFSVLVIRLDEITNRVDAAAEEPTHQTLGFLMRDEIRTTDLLGKRLDNSFFIILHYTDLENAVNVGQRIRERVEHYTFETVPGKDHRTISIGVSCFPTNANDVTGLIKKAEDLLAKAQDQGGNNVLVPDP
jgi:diguanylate cyclase (GGDEF)-like protein